MTQTTTTTITCFVCAGKPSQLPPLREVRKLFLEGTLESPNQQLCLPLSNMNSKSGVAGLSS